MNDGGPAFPEHHYFDPGRGQYGMHMTASDVGCGGMSLRDWFAGMALQGILASNREFESVEKAKPGETKLQRVRIAIEHADAMIAALERKEPA